jgi:tetratricopeptide (TPR) repeat protein
VAVSANDLKSELDPGRFANLLRRPLLLTLSVSLLVVSPSHARAADERAEPASSAEQRRNSAKARYEEGVEAYRATRYADAVRLFLEADAISPSAALSYNIARAYEKLADDAQTLRWYRNYLRLDPNAKNAAEVRGYVESLSAKLAKQGIQQLTVLTTPAGATVAIDGTRVRRRERQIYAPRGNPNRSERHVAGGTGG